MPKRTNSFQSLIFLLEQQLSSAGFTVSESKMLVDLSTGEEREADIVIEGEVNKTPIMIAIECTSETRPATMPWIEKIAGKYRNIPVSSILLVSKSGFVKNAEGKAQSKDPRIKLYTLEEAISADWSETTRYVSQVVFQHYLFHPESVTTIFMPGDNIDIEVVGSEVLLFRVDGQTEGTIAQIINEDILVDPAFHNGIKSSLPDNNSHGIYDVSFNFQFSETRYILHSNSEKRWVQGFHIKGKYYVLFQEHFTQKTTYKQLPFAFATDEVFGHELVATFTESEGDELKVGFKIMKKPSAKISKQS